MDDALDLPALGLNPFSSLGIIAASEFGNLAGRITNHFITTDHVSVAQPHFFSRCQPEELAGRIFQKVILFDVDFTR